MFQPNATRISLRLPPPRVRYVARGIPTLTQRTSRALMIFTPIPVKEFKSNSRTSTSTNPRSIQKWMGKRITSIIYINVLPLFCVICLRLQFSSKYWEYWHIHIHHVTCSLIYDISINKSRTLKILKWWSLNLKGKST